MTALSAPATLHSLPERRPDRLEAGSSLSLLEPTRLADHVDVLYRAARALYASRPDAEDLVQETFAQVLRRPRFVRQNHELAYLLRALVTRTRAGTGRPAGRCSCRCQPMRLTQHPDPSVRADEIMQAIASAPARYRDAVIAVDVVGLSYQEAGRALRAREATIASRLHRGRQHVASVLTDSK